MAVAAEWTVLEYLDPVTPEEPPVGAGMLVDRDGLLWRRDGDGWRAWTQMWGMAHPWLVPLRYAPLHPATPADLAEHGVDEQGEPVGKGEADEADDRIAQIEARLAAATPGPWRIVYWSPDEPEVNAILAEKQTFVVCANEDPIEPADATLIAHAPDDLRYLLDALAAERTELRMRELHHFEEEKLRAEAEAERDALAAEVARLRREGCYPAPRVDSVSVGRPHVHEWHTLWHHDYCWCGATRRQHGPDCEKCDRVEADA